jgi:hypothetical protein
MILWFLAILIILYINWKLVVVAFFIFAAWYFEWVLFFVFFFISNRMGIFIDDGLTIQNGLDIALGNKRTIDWLWCYSLSCYLLEGSWCFSWNICPVQHFILDLICQCNTCLKNDLASFWLYWLFEFTGHRFFRLSIGEPEWIIWWF